MKLDIKNLLRKIQYYILNTFYYDKKSIQLFWYRKIHNFGDIINPILIHQLTLKPIQHVNIKHYKETHYISIGSILHKATKHTIVWGSGFMSEESKCKERPKEILAVRGPKTRNKLLDQGIECPEVYGDPALLLPKIYNPKIKKKYKLGIVPHFVDKQHKWLSSLEDNSEVLVLDILEKNPFKFIDDLLSCEKIASSSLHGIIVSDAYNITSVWIEFSNDVYGDGFKFKDYFLSVKRKDSKPIVINNDITLNDILESFYEYEIDIDLDRLIKACPFNLRLNNIHNVDK